MENRLGRRKEEWTGRANKEVRRTLNPLPGPVIGEVWERKKKSPLKNRKWGKHRFRFCSLQRALWLLRKDAVEGVRSGRGELSLEALAEARVRRCSDPGKAQGQLGLSCLLFVKGRWRRYSQEG